MNDEQIKDMIFLNGKLAAFRQILEYATCGINGNGDIKYLDSIDIVRFINDLLKGHEIALMHYVPDLNRPCCHSLEEFP